MDLDDLDDEFYTSEDDENQMLEYTRNDLFKSCDSLVRLYAWMGLHRYNLRQGTNLQLGRVEKYKRTTHSAASAFLITLVAVDPDKDSSLTFQTEVCERNFGKFTLGCPIACPKGESTHEGVLGIPGDLDDSLPEWPPEDPFKNRNLFYLLKKSELQKHYDWIQKYLELAVGTARMNMGRDPDLSGLEIVKVAVQTIDDDVEPQQPNETWLNAMNAIVYIRYKDFCEDRVGRDVDRIAVVRRSFNESIECFMLDGLNESSEILPKKKGKKQSRRRLHKRRRCS